MEVARDLVLFSGCGGATAGLVAAGWDVAACVDGWQAACVAHRRWHPTIPTLRARIEDAHRLLRGPFRRVWASPSCKPYSMANRMPKRGEAHPEYYPPASLVEQAFEAWGAEWLVVENVGGLLWSREGKHEIGYMRKACEVRGLRMYPSVVNSNTVGVAQIRRRVFIVVGPEYVRIPHGSDYIPLENAETPPMACEGSNGSWERETRWPKAARAVGGGDHERGKTSDTRRAVKGVAANEHGLARSRQTRIAWGERQAAQRGSVDASAPSRHANWTVARSSVRGGEHLGSRQREGYPSSAAGRTLAECCDLQQIPPYVVAGFSKRVAHELVGNCVPWPLAYHVASVLLRQDGQEPLSKDEGARDTPDVARSSRGDGTAPTKEA